ncbi:SDR family NAD(P)-dependent oxidoreductase [Shewanella maritima]|uniref:SDR family NAD(P)-dependent oxidoreductase n=1 Tax=Shewanella maritima TaxID=2520507 RepID=UPI003735D859
MSQAVLITGASSGIGFELAKHYVAQGWQVIACGRNAQQLALLSGVHPLVFDITDASQVKAAGEQLAHVIAQHDLSLSAVILNAGTCEYIDDVIKFDSALFQRVIHTNVIATGYCLEAFLPQLAAGGRLALMSSSATFLPFSRAQAYGASKAAITYLADSLRVDLVSRNIGVSVINPGFVETPLTDKNDFAMPMRISAQQAAQAIYKGMINGKSDIHFPKKFTWLLKLFSLLPNAWITRALAPKPALQHNETRKMS